MKASVESQAERLAESLRRAGEPEAEVQRRVQRALESARNRSSRKVPRREIVNPYAGCVSLTDGARQLWMRRTDVIAKMERDGWLVRISDRWRATQQAIDSGWLVERGPDQIRYAQITPDGIAEIARRMGIAPGA